MSSPARDFPDLRRYKRLDPFTAASALRKLHSSLPNDTESCRYKITRNLPAETLDDIVSYVDSQCDLLSLAWSCHEMHNLVFHAHFEHRVVKARVSSMRVWHRLAVCRTLARNVRHLEIVDGKSPEIIPTDITTTDTDVENTYDGSDLPAKREELLASAIAEMHGLKSLKWSHTDSLILIGSVWPTLRNCPNLTLVNLDDSTLFSPPKVQDPEEKEGDNHVDEDTALKGITTVSVKCNGGFGTVMNPDLAQISGLLLSCPDLENLEITYLVPPVHGFIHPTASGLYSYYGCWKNLTSLTLNNLSRTAPQDLVDLATFLSEHDNLETLHFKSIGINTAALLLKHNTLPRLKELKSDKNFANAILSCSSDSPRPLKAIKGIDLGGSKSDRAFLANLALVSDGISRIELAGWKKMKDLRELLQCVPKLTWLNVGNTANRAMSAYGPDHWVEALGRIPRIETFFGVKLLRQIPDIPVGDMSESDRSKFMDNNRVASTLAQKCPELRRLQHWDDGGSKVIVLVRGDPECKYKVMLENRSNS